MTPLPVLPGLRWCVAARQPAAPARASTCSHPHCGRTVAHRHHAIPRGQTCGPVDWIEVEGVVIANVIDFCAAHHDQLESQWGGCKARLRWASGWVWYDRADDYKITTENVGKAYVWWWDKKNDSIWKMVGFCKGEYRYVAA